MLICDTHVHIYPQFNFEEFFRSAYSNLNLLAPEAEKILCLTERSTEHYFHSVQDQSVSVPSFIFSKSSDSAWIAVQGSAGEKLWLVSGRQIVTHERLEVLALSSSAQMPQGLSARATVEAVLLAGAVPVLPYSPGKWTFARAKVLTELVREFGDSIFLADSALRAHALPRPRIFQNRRVLAGTDPWPQAGEEQRVGKFASLIEGGLDEQALTSSFKRCLNESPAIISKGRRMSLPHMLLNQLKLRLK